MNRLGLIAIVCVALIGSAASALLAADATLTPISVITLPADNSAVLWYAQDLGYFKDAGLDVKVTNMTNNEAITAAIASGAGDVGNSAVVPVADARAKGIPVLFISPAGLFDLKSPTSFLVVAKDSPIRSARDLTDKTVAVAGLGGLTHFATRAWIDQHGGSSEKVKFIELPFPAMIPAIQQHRVDAAYTVEPFYTGASGDVRILGYAAESVATRFLATGWIATEAWLSTHAETALKFNAAIRRAALWANGHHAESAAILLKYTKLDPAIVERMNRVVYATTLDPKTIQPSIDMTAKYTNQSPVQATTLIWPPAK
jgi:NitT/TauT family transport system substrate-binding protein